LPDLLRHFPAWLEGNNELTRNCNRLARPRVPCLSRLPFLNLEHPEIAEFDSAFLHQRFDEAIENPLDDFLNFRRRQAHFFRYRFDKFLLGHERAPKQLGVEPANQGFILRFDPARDINSSNVGSQDEQVHDLANARAAEGDAEAVRQPDGVLVDFCDAAKLGDCRILALEPLTIACSFDPRQRRRPSRKQLQRGGASPPPPVLSGRVPRLARLLALAIRCEQLLKAGVIANYAELAALGHVSRARITQVMNLLLLAPDIQEALLFLPRTERGRDSIHLRQFQPLALVADWGDQRKRWQALVSNRELGQPG
jgi:hypothetical protein